MLCKQPTGAKVYEDNKITMCLSTVFKMYGET